MEVKFGFSDYKEHDFYHIRLGKGAVIIAIKNDSNDPSQKNKINSDFHIASIFNSRNQEIMNDKPYIDPVSSIEEKDGTVRVTINFERLHKNKPSYRPVRAIVRRILPAEQVTFEIVEENNSEQT